MDETTDSRDAAKVRVTLYTRPGCRLCDEAKEVMRAARCEGRYALLEIDIDGDPELVRRYGRDIPVIMINGIETFRHRLTASEFEREIRRANSR